MLQWYNPKNASEDWQNGTGQERGKGCQFLFKYSFYSQNGLAIETFEKGKLFTTKIVDDLLGFSNEIYGLNFDESNTPKAIYVVEDLAVIVYEKGNQIYFGSEENEEFKIMKGIGELFCFLPDEKIYFGIMKIEEKERH